jgi:hypothetical protein
MTATAPTNPEDRRRLRELLTALEDPVGLFVVFRSIEDKAEIAKILAAVLDTEGDRQQPTSATSTLRGAAESAFAFLDSIEWTDHTSAEEAENVKQMLQEAIAVTERETK